MFEEPVTRSPSYWGASHSRVPFDHPFFGAQSGLRPAIDITEEGKNYVLEAELPGVKKEDIEVHVGDNGRSVTIEGKLFSRKSLSRSTDMDTGESSKSGSTLEDSSSTPIVAEREFIGNATFTRTVTLPERVDGHNVAAKLSDGILVVTVPKLEDDDRVVVPVD